MTQIGHVSGCHLNAAAFLGLWAGRRFPAAELAPYIIAQVLGALAGAAVLYVIASGKPGFDAASGFAQNGFGEHSPEGIVWASAIRCWRAAAPIPQRSASKRQRSLTLHDIASSIGPATSRSRCVNPRST